MLNRRSFSMAALAIATVPFLSRGAAAAGRPMLVFVGHEL
jgi:hypothetical protein